MEDYTNYRWQRPQRKVFDGRYVRLEPVSEEHLEDLLKFMSGEEAIESMRYLNVNPMSMEELTAWLTTIKESTKRMEFAIVDKASRKVGGKISYLRIKENHGTAELGGVLFGPLIAKKPAATEAVYLLTNHVFEDLGYRRFEWKCHAENLPSKRAALRYGFKYEAVFRQHMIQKGKERDSIWLAMIDNEWPIVKEAFGKWLAPENFDEKGVQKKRLQDFRSPIL